MKTYNIEQIKKYILSQDSLGDVLYNLKEENIDKANTHSIIDMTQEDWDDEEEFNEDFDDGLDYDMLHGDYGDRD